MNITSLLGYVRDTRTYGHTYIHAAVRRSVTSYDGLRGTLNGEPVAITYTGWGRSLQSKRGHKYKAHCRYVRTGKPVPSVALNQIVAA